VPAIGVMTTRFVSAAEMMRRVLGMPDYRFVVIDHPISSASAAQLADYARATVAQARALLLRT
jgi:hypothetical protein